MHIDVAELRAFYASPLGWVARRAIGSRIRARWTTVGGEVVMGVGFASPYLGSFRLEAQRLGALMPGGQGALVWPGTGLIHTVMVDEDQLPLPDNSVHRLLAVHSLELAGNPRSMLREMWRVLAPEGRILLVVPNRRGVWARFDATPFGYGQPYSRTQLEKLLRDALFEPFAWNAALYMPPLRGRRLARWSAAFERIGARLWPRFAGVLLVEARKELMAPVGTGVVRAARRVEVPVANATRIEGPAATATELMEKPND